MRAEKHSKVCRKTKQEIGIRWKFWKYDPDRQQNVPVPVGQIPLHIRNSQNENEVLAYCNSQLAVQDALKHRAQQLREWKERYHDFQEYLDKFAVYQKQRAPNSWENDVFYLENYAFGYFLSKSSLNNINQWPSMFDDFRKWLSETRPLKYNRKNLALNTQIKIIKALNRFLAFCHSKGWVESLPKCPAYHRDDTVVVTASDLFEEEEIPLIYGALKQSRLTSADLFIVLIRTGLRINETLGLSPSFLYQGILDGQKTSLVHKRLSHYALSNYHGYICLENQPALKSIRARNAFTDRFSKQWLTGSVPRKPLKCRRRIDPKYFRLIPIFDAQAWNILVDRAISTEELRGKNCYGNEPQNYLLFDGLTSTMFAADLTAVMQKLDIRKRSTHKTRHTFLTWLYSIIGEDEFLADKIAGHRDRRDIERYCHLSEIIGREQSEKHKGKHRLQKV